MIPVLEEKLLETSISHEGITCSPIRVVFDPGLQHDPSEAVSRHVHVGRVQALVVSLAQTVVDGSRYLDGVWEVSQPAGGDPRPEANSRQLFLNLGNQWPVLLARNLRRFFSSFCPGFRGDKFKVFQEKYSRFSRKNIPGFPGEMFQVFPDRKSRFSRRNIQGLPGEI